MDMQMMSLEQAQRLVERPALVTYAKPNRSAVENAQDSSANEAQKARMKALYDTAFKVGVTSGMAWQIENINSVVKSMSRDLDLIYDFNALMIGQRTVPAVITEARDVYNQDGDYAVRLSGGVYKIDRQARFSSVSPSWREYLSFSKGRAADVDELLAAKSDEDRALWRDVVKKGWDQGVEQANIMLTQGMDRLNRDYTGMIRFHRFVIEGKVSLPVIASEDVALTQSGSTLVVDETLLRLTTLPEFNSKIGSWNAIIKSGNAAVDVPKVVLPVASKSAASDSRPAEPAMMKADQ